MNRIILNELGLRWWFWGLIGLLCLVFGSCADAHQDLFYGAVYPAIFGASFLALQLQYGRILLTLPFTARQIGRTVWILNVVIPSLLLALFTGLGIFLNSHLTFLTEIKSDLTDLTTTPTGFLASWFQLTVVGSLGFGSIFWLFSRIPAKREQWENLRAQLYGSAILIAVIAAGYLLARSAISNEIKFGIICLLGIFFTLLGWFRAERFVIEYGGFRRETASVARPKEMYKPRPGYGGIPFLIINCCIRYIAATVFLTVAVFGIILCFVVAHPDPNPEPLKRADVLDAMKVFSFYSIFLSFWMVLPIAVHQKFLRSLPLTSKELAVVILSLPVVPFFVLFGILTLFEIQAFGFPAAMSLLKGEILWLPPICVFATAIVWNNERKFLRFVIALIVFILSAIPAMYPVFWPSGKDLPLWMIITIPLVSCLLALYIINRLLERNDMTYRTQMQNFIRPEVAMW